MWLPRNAPYGDSDGEIEGLVEVEGLSDGETEVDGLALDEGDEPVQLTLSNFTTVVFVVVCQTPALKPTMTLSIPIAFQAL